MHLTNALICDFCSVATKSLLTISTVEHTICSSLQQCSSAMATHIDSEHLLSPFVANTVLYKVIFKYMKAYFL